MRAKRKNILLSILAIAAMSLAITAAIVSARKPSLDRVWDEDVRVLAGIESTESDSISFTQVRDWTYQGDTVVSKRYFDAQYDPADIVDMWLYEQKLDDVGLIAHTFVVFEFDERYASSRFLGLSVETRREEAEEYSIVGGALRSFEITHIWATEEDLVRRRVQHLDYPLTRYRLDISHEARTLIFKRFAEETAELAIHPRWYNTVSNNCTSSLISYVNQGQPGAIPFHYSYVFTGKVDDYLGRLGYVDQRSATPITRSFLESNNLR